MSTTVKDLENRQEGDMGSIGIAVHTELALNPRYKLLGRLRLDSHMRSFATLRPPRSVYAAVGLHTGDILHPTTGDHLLTRHVMSCSAPLVTPESQSGISRHLLIPSYCIVAAHQQSGIECSTSTPYLCLSGILSE
jgi:hypothetical protein